MAAREDLKQLYHDLRSSRFGFVPAGEHHIRDVYSFVQSTHPQLCDDEYLCSQNCKSGYNSPEWKHKVRTALWDTRKEPEFVRSGDERGMWLFREPGTVSQIDLIANDLEIPESKRVEITTRRIVRDTTLAKQIKQIHDCKCQICGFSIELPDGTFYAEAHHIQPLGSPHDGPDIAGNIIVVCPNHHAMCDYAAIQLNLIELRQHPNHVVDEIYIEYHNNMATGTPMLK